MAVTSLDMTPAKFTANPSTMNKRWPPLADKTALPYKLTSLSRQKLAREATAPNPDIRRCLGHFRLHCTSMEWAQKDMTTRINSFELEDDDEDEEEGEQQRQQQQEKQEREIPLLGADEPEKNKIKPRKDDEDEEGPDKKELHVHFQISVKPSSNAPSSPSPQSSTSSTSSSPSQSSPASNNRIENTEKDGILEKGISCLEKTVQKKNFWLTSGQCIPVRIAS